MIDIIDQLRERTENIDVIFEAADEIESLRSELEQAKVDKAALQKVAFTAQEMAKEIAERAEAEAAKAAFTINQLEARIRHLSKRVGELEATLEHNNSALDGANAIIARLEADSDECTCHPSEALQPCQKKYAFSECKISWLEDQLRAAHVWLAAAGANNTEYCARAERAEAQRDAMRELIPILIEAAELGGIAWMPIWDKARTALNP